MCLGFEVAASLTRTDVVTLQVLGQAVTPDEEMNGENGAQAGVNGDASTDSITVKRQQLLFCERFVEFLIDLMSQAPTRRYAHALLEDKAVLIKCRMSALFQQEQGSS